ncbi:hypothetical protein ACO1O0_005133 [Amphichorda felina]
MQTRLHASEQVYGIPPVLECSDLGNLEVLERAGPSLLPYQINVAEDQTIDGILSGRSDEGTLISNKDKILGWNSIDISSKLRPTEEDVAALGPEFKAAWDRDFTNTPNRPLMLLGLVS